MNWWKKALKTPKLLKEQVPWLVQLPGTAEPIHSLSKPDEDFNSRSQLTGKGFQLPEGEFNFWLASVLH